MTPATGHQFISSLAHGSSAHRPILPYRLTGSPTHWLTGSLATGHRPPTTHHRPPAHLLTGSPATCSPATSHRLTGSPATGHPPPAHPPPAHRPPATGRRPPATGRPPASKIKRLFPRCLPGFKVVLISWLAHQRCRLSPRRNQETPRLNWLECRMSA